MQRRFIYLTELKFKLTKKKPPEFYHIDMNAFVLLNDQLNN